jgi:ubiquinone/menaquinone biosynthesis C-methylase UbiE
MESVKDTYNIIASHFSKTRYKVWNGVSKFLDTIPTNQYCLDIGCGNGKNMLYRTDLKFSGIDICANFVKICQSRNLDVIEGNMLYLPYESEIFDNVICIAAVHHMRDKMDRVKAISEMFRVCKKGGSIFVLVWSFVQPENSKRKFNTTDEMVSWNMNGTTVYRYYHLYHMNELQEEFNMTGYKFEVVSDFYEMGNWGLIIKSLL